MKKMPQILFFVLFFNLFFLWTNVGVSAQNPHKYLRKGDDAYKENNFEQSQQYYEQARNKKNAAQID